MNIRGCAAIFGVVIVAFAVIGLWFARMAYIGSPRAGGSVFVTITAEERASDVARDLAEKKVIASAFWYRVYAWFDASADHPKAGSYELQPGSSFHAIARLLAAGPIRQESRLRIIEGWNVEDIAKYLSDEKRIKPEDTFRLIGTSADRSPFEVSLRNEFSFLKSLPADRSLEGYLFPDTYRVWDDELPEGLFRKQLHEFQDRFGDAVVTSKSAPLRTLDEVVTLASIIEKEVREPEDRRIVAGIFLRRLREGMALQSDATLTYVTGSTRSRSTTAELQIDSPYNSYQNRGLPPSPICNPGEDAIQAVLNPTPSNYRYFLTDKDGNVLYAATLEEHVNNKIKAGY